MNTLPVSLSWIRATDGPTTPVGGAGETSFGEILERQVDGGRDADVHPVRSDAAGARLERPRRDPVADASTQARDHTPGAVDRRGATDRIDVAADRADRADDADDADDTTEPVASHIDRRAEHHVDAAGGSEPACLVAVPQDGRGQSPPAPSGQASAEVVTVAEVAAVGGPAVPAAGPAAAAVEPLTTAAAAPPAGGRATDAATATALDAPAGAAPATAADGMPVITSITVETEIVADAATVTSLPPSLPASLPASLPTSAPAAPGGTSPETYGASPMSWPIGAAPGASATTADAAPATPTRSATPATPTPTASPAATPTASAAENATPSAATSAATGAATTAIGAAAVVPVSVPGPATAAAAAAADDAPATSRVRGDAVPALTSDADAPVGQINGAGAAAATTPSASASPTDASPTVSAPLRSGDIAVQAQRDAQIRRAEHLTRLGIDVTTDGLGAIRIEASNAGGGLQLNLGAERASTRHLLAEQVAVLRDELGGADVSVDVGRGNTGQQPASERGDHRRQPGALPDTTRQTTDATTRRRPALTHLVDGDRGLDLHL